MARRRKHFGITLTIPASAYRKAKGKVARENRRRHGRTSMPSGGELATNRDRAVVEVYEFRNRKTGRPFTAYVSSKNPRSITNFTGVRLCDIVRRTGVKGVRARCIDGREYVGRSNGPGMWISLRPAAK